MNKIIKDGTVRNIYYAQFQDFFLQKTLPREKQHVGDIAHAAPRDRSVSSSYFSCTTT